MNWKKVLQWVTFIVNLIVYFAVINMVMMLILRIVAAFGNRNPWWAYCGGLYILLDTLVLYFLARYLFREIVLLSADKRKEQCEQPSLQDKPTGVGIENFIDAKRTIGYSTIYAQNIKDSSASQLKSYAINVYLNFNKYRELILNSKIHFIYVYGDKSSGLHEREKIKNYNNITLISFKNSKHWVHRDASNEFMIFLSNIFSADQSISKALSS